MDCRLSGKSTCFRLLLNSWPKVIDLNFRGSMTWMRSRSGGCGCWVHKMDGLSIKMTISRMHNGLELWPRTYATYIVQLEFVGGTISGWGQRSKPLIHLGQQCGELARSPSTLCRVIHFLEAGPSCNRDNMALTAMPMSLFDGFRGLCIDAIADQATNFGGFLWLCSRSGIQVLL